MDEDGFQFVSHKKAYKRNKVKALQAKVVANQQRNHNPSLTPADIIHKLNKHVGEITNADFWSQLQDIVKKGSLQPEISCVLCSGNECASDCQTKDVSLVCYGIGAFADDLISSYQMALLIALRDTLELAQSQCLVYDPIFCDLEKSVIQHLNMTLLDTNEEGKRPVTSKTLFYMPHCGKPLYNNLLWKNWSLDSLSKLYIIGNRFSSMVERNPKRILEKEALYILKIHPYMEEKKIPNVFEHKDIFNDTAFIRFPRDNLLKAPPELWTDKAEPVYSEDQPEIIINK